MAEDRPASFKPDFFEHRGGPADLAVFPKIKAVVYFDKPVSPMGHLAIDSSKSSLTAFTSFSKSSVFAGGEASVINSNG